MQPRRGDSGAHHAYGSGVRCCAGSGTPIITGMNVARPGTNTGEYRLVTGDVRAPAGTMAGSTAGAVTTNIAAGPVRADPAKANEAAVEAMAADSRTQAWSGTGRARARPAPFLSAVRENGDRTARRALRGTVPDFRPPSIPLVLHFCIVDCPNPFLLTVSLLAATLSLPWFSSASSPMSGRM
jgi:hypothetical protein